VNIPNEPWCDGLSLLLAARPGPAPGLPRRVKLERVAISRQEIIDMLNHLGYSEAAEDASRVLPGQVDLKQVKEFSDRHGISRTELESQMGGSP